jgi:plasmid stabilization system protein ParE
MDYRVEISARAEAELADAFAHIASHSPANAAIWLDKLYQAAESLSRFPTRCALAPEALAIDLEVRQYMYAMAQGSS